MKLLFTTVAFGDLYLNFAAIYIYSIKKAYPDCDVKIYTGDKIPNNVKNILKLTNLENCLIEKDFSMFEREIPVISSLRWLYDYKDVKDYDCVYTGDVDFFICHDSVYPELLEYHLNNCRINNLPYSNIVRPKSYRVSGLHFYKVEDYYNKANDKIQEFKKKLKNKNYSILRHPKSLLDRDDDEELLYRLIEESNIGFPKIKHNRLHHGIHFKRRYKREYLEREKELVGYRNNFIAICDHDEVFKQILPLINYNARKYIFKCYEILK